MNSYKNIKEKNSSNTYRQKEEKLRKTIGKMDSNVHVFQMQSLQQNTNFL